MGSSGPKPLEEKAKPPPSFSENWKERILIPDTPRRGQLVEELGWCLSIEKLMGSLTFQQLMPLILPSSAAAIAGHHMFLGTVLKLEVFDFSGAREFVRVVRKSEPDDLVNSTVAGFGSGALLGRLQGGQFGAFRYAVIFAVVGTTVDFATIKLRPALSSYKQSIFKDKEKNPGWLKLPEWSPIQVLDEEELAAKKAREKELYAAQSALGKLSKEES
ncbi:hypothetical protein OIU74_011760 [Salix koriyanagi]|uniref:Uncharacterized protein n=1 Tax=Salix koriyanagi TaxID=2511006 RepID=A0A9Q0TG39_9ROSI|nr:hypothetical protein OIU74_011760 [Salix koriyanagi]